MVHSFGCHRHDCGHDRHDDGPDGIVHPVHHRDLRRRLRVPVGQRQGLTLSS
jgi:hypothetical protein